MKNCLKVLLLLLASVNFSASRADACCFLPLLLDPCHWGCGLFHQDPYATRRFIDDWLGYGYLRGNQNGSLGHYPLEPWNCYRPMYPRVMPHCPLLSHCPLFPCLKKWSHGYGCGPAPYQPMVPPMNCQPMLPPPMPCAPMQCAPMQCQPMPVPVQVPVTTWRPVTIDRGSYQMVWVPRPVTEMVPQTSWQTQYSVPNAAPTMMPGVPEDCCGSSMQQPFGMPMPMQNYPAQPPLQVPMQSGCGDTPCQSGGMAWNRGPGMNMARAPFGNPAAAAWRPGINAWQPQMAYGNPWQPAFPSGASNSWQSMPAAPSWQTMPQSAAIPGDIMGDHEIATVPGMNPVTGMTPVIPQSYTGGGVPVHRTSYMNTARLPPVNRYRNSVR
jgi:hypothetical protein